MNRFTLFFLSGVVGLACLTNTAVADRDTGKAKKHICPAGTEMYGAAPPAATNIWCRQSNGDGTFARQGLYTSYSRKGTVRVQGNYERDKPHGVWTKFDRNGKRISATVFYDGSVTQKFKFKDGGKTIDKKHVQSVAAVEKARAARKQQRELNDWRTGKAVLTRNWKDSHTGTN